MNGCLFVVVVLFFTVIWLAFLSVSTFFVFLFHFVTGYIIWPNKIFWSIHITGLFECCLVTSSQKC